MLLLLVALGFAQDPPGPDVEPGEPVEQLDTAEVSETQTKLAAVYTEVERLQAVQVDVANGVAHLRGAVSSVGAREEAASIAESFGDIIFVDNQLTVRGAADAPAQSDASRDATIQSTLASIYSQVHGLGKVEVTVVSGVVRLTGTVVEEGVNEKAVALAETVEGVVYVDDAIVASTAVDERLAPALQKMLDRLQTWVAMLPLLAIGAVVVALAYFVGRWLSGWDALFGRARHRPLMRAMLGRMIRLFVMVIGVLFAFEIIGATALVGAVAGAAGVVGLAFGFAFQDIVENYLAGILLSVQQPFSKDDLIEVAGVKGIVVRLSMRNTLLLTLDGNHTYLPNAEVFKGTVTNFTRNSKRRFSFAIGVGTDEDLVKVIQTGEATLADTAGVLLEPPPKIRVEALGDSSVTVMAYGWVEQTKYDFISVRTEAIRRLKEAYDQAGYDMPEPIYRVRLHQEDPPAKKPPVVRHKSDGPAVDLAPDFDLQDQVDATRAGEGEDLLKG